MKAAEVGFREGLASFLERMKGRKVSRFRRLMKLIMPHPPIEDRVRKIREHGNESLKRLS